MKKVKNSVPTAKAKAKRTNRKEAEKQIKEDSSNNYVDIYDEIVLKQESFNKIRKQADWGLGNKMLDEDEMKAKHRKLAAMKRLDNVEKGKSKW